MNPEDDWELPPDYRVAWQANGSFILFRDDLPIRQFPSATSKRAIEAWCAAYEAGRTAGLQDGLVRGRNALAGELRALLQVAWRPPASDGRPTCAATCAQVDRHP